MAIPDKPLELNVESNELTLDEMALFSMKGFDWYDFRQFLIDHSVSWTAEEIGKIKVGELELVAKDIQNAAERVAVPLATSPRSKTGRGSSPKTSRRGRSTTSTRNNSAANQKMSQE